MQSSGVFNLQLTTCTIYIKVHVMSDFFFGKLYCSCHTFEIDKFSAARNVQRAQLMGVYIYYKVNINTLLFTYTLEKLSVSTPCATLLIYNKYSKYLHDILLTGVWTKGLAPVGDHVHGIDDALCFVITFVKTRLYEYILNFRGQKLFMHFRVNEFRIAV